MKKRLRWLVLCGVALIILVAVTPESWVRGSYRMTIGRFFRHSVESRLAQFGDAASARIDISVLPEAIDVIALKNEKSVELWGKEFSGKIRFIKSYPILAASGTVGPKLKEGDWQVPEGIYGIESLHPNSNFYLALKIDYPSADDRKTAISEKRDVDKLGSAIMLHGKGGSIGCIAISNEAIEEIFYLVAKVGVKNTRILICPYDFRKSSPPEHTEPSWLAERYQQLDQELKTMRLNYSNGE